jgi:pimeloyl-ACP methyl ester carboxylesterase
MRRYGAMSLAVGIGAALLVILMGGAIVQALLVRRDRRRFQPPGRTMAGLHARLAGAGRPPVVFEAGMAASSSNWSAIQAEVARATSTCSYDRRGLGWSVPRPGEASLQMLTDDLHTLLDAFSIPRPIVLVGHSFGTLIARVYAHRFPAEVGALVLVDPVTPEEWTNPGWRARLRLRRAVFFARAAGALAAVGLARVGLWGLLRRGGGNPGPLLGLSSTMRRIAVEVTKLPADALPALRARWSDARFFTAMADAIRAMPACAIEAARQPIPRGLPVTVLSSAQHSADRLAAHRAMATRHLVVSASGHWIHLDQPDAAVEAIRGAIEDVGQVGR